jgi:tetratricopeptide (TPR) repeat protein
MASPLFQQAVQAAKAGDKKKALVLLRDVVAAEPRNEMAWIWLSEVSDNLEVRVYALEKALALNPGRTAVQNRLNTLIKEAEKEDKQPVTSLDEVIVLAGNGRFSEARNKLMGITDREPHNEQAWLLLSVLVDSLEDKIIALENALSINPRNPEIKKLLSQRQQNEVDKLTMGRVYEKKEDWPNAIHAYGLASTVSPIASVQEIARLRLKALDKNHALYSQTSPTVTLLRLMAGPPLLYGLLLFIHSGFKPLQIPLPSCLGGLAVLFGSFLWIASANTPDHPLWKTIPMPQSVQRYLLPIMGLLIVSLPFILFILSTIERLNLFQASAFR